MYAIKILELSAMKKETRKLSRRDTELKKNVYFAIFILLEKNNELLNQRGNSLKQKATYT